MKYPLVSVALCYGAGILCAAFLHVPLLVVFAMAAFGTVLAIVLARWRAGLLALALFFTGWVHYEVRTLALSPHDLRRLFGNRTEIVAVRGRLLETPVERVSTNHDRPSFRTIARVAVEAVRRKDHWQPASGIVATTSRGLLPDRFYEGRRVMIGGVLTRPPVPIAPGLFNFRRYLRHAGIYYLLRTDGAVDWRLRDADRPPARPLSDRFLRWSKRTLSRGLPEPDESLRLLWAMVLGWKTALTDEVSKPFRRSGTMHIFAISGLHIALIAGVLVALTRTLQIPRGVCGIVVIPLIWFYTAATGWQPSAIRATIMMSIVIAGWALKRPSNLINSLAGAACLILLWDPLQLFQVGFQLSFLVVLSIALFLAPLQRWLGRLWQSDPFLPEELRPRWQRWGGRPLRWVVASFATSLAAWMGSAPLTAGYFHLFTPISLLANLAIVPLSSLALMSALGSLLCGPWLSWIGVLFNHSAWFWMTAVRWTSDLAASIPGGWWHMATPEPLFFPFYYALLIGILAGAFQHRRFRVWTTAVIVLVGCGWAGQSWHARHETRLTVLPLDGGHAVYFDPPGQGSDWLVDTGDSSAAEYVTIPFLGAQGVNHLAHLAITQGDVHQMGGADQVQAEFPVMEWVTSTVPQRSSYYRKLMEELHEPGYLQRQVSRGEFVSPWRVLHPETTDHFARADDDTLVLTARINGVKVLLLSELGRKGQTALLRREKNLHADILIAGLPNQGEPLRSDLLQAIHPELIIIADSEFPATRRASLALRNRLARFDTSVLYTRDSGAIVLSFDDGHWLVTPTIHDGKP